MKRWLPLLLCLTLILVLPAPLSPQQKPGSETKPEPADQTLRVTVNIVIAPTTVTDRKGNYVNGLKPQEFRLFDNDKLQEITQDIGFLPLSIVVCVQKSSNVEILLPKIRKMGTVMRDLLVGQDGEVAILAFDHRIQMLQDFTNDTDKINAAMEKLTPGSTSSRLVDTVIEATRMLRNKKDRRKVILLISETLDRASEASFREVATNVQVNNIDVYTLNMNRWVTSLTAKPGVPRPSAFPSASQPRAGPAIQEPTSQAQVSGAPGYGIDFVPVIEEAFRAVKAIFVSNPAEVLTKFTGGREYSFITQADLERAIGDIGRELRSQYLLSYNPNNKVEGGFHKIVVDVARPGLRVRTRPGYWMAGVPE